MLGHEKGTSGSYTNRESKKKKTCAREARKPVKHTTREVNSPMKTHKKGENPNAELPVSIPLSPPPPLYHAVETEPAQITACEFHQARPW